MPRPLVSFVIGHLLVCAGHGESVLFGSCDRLGCQKHIVVRSVKGRLHQGPKMWGKTGKLYPIAQFIQNLILILGKVNYYGILYNLATLFSPLGHPLAPPYHVLDVCPRGPSSFHFNKNWQLKIRREEYNVWDGMRKWVFAHISGWRHLHAASAALAQQTRHSLDST